MKSFVITAQVATAPSCPWRPPPCNSSPTPCFCAGLGEQLPRVSRPTYEFTLFRQKDSLGLLFGSFPALAAPPIQFPLTGPTALSRIPGKDVVFGVLGRFGTVPPLSCQLGLERRGGPGSECGTRLRPRSSPPWTLWAQRPADEGADPWEVSVRLLGLSVCCVRPCAVWPSLPPPCCHLGEPVSKMGRQGEQSLRPVVMLRPFQLRGTEKGDVLGRPRGFRSSGEAEGRQGGEGQGRSGRQTPGSEQRDRGRGHTHACAHGSALACARTCSPPAPGACRWVSAGADGTDGNTAPTSHLHPRGAGEHLLGLTVSVTNMHMNKTSFTLCPGLQMDI